MIAELIYTRKSKKISQESLNALLGVTDGQVNKWECGARLPSSFNLMCWCNALGLTIKLEAINDKMKKYPSQPVRQVAVRLEINTMPMVGG